MANDLLNVIAVNRVIFGLRKSDLEAINKFQCLNVYTKRNVKVLVFAFLFNK